MLKKIASLLLSLLLCLSLLPGQARAGDVPAPDDPPVITGPLDPEDPDGPDEPEPPVEPQSEEVPGDKDDYRI